MTGTLYIIATPIGNLKDITYRAIETLSQSDLILCEDTRVTKKLIDNYNIKTPLESFHEHTDPNKYYYVLKLLQEGKNISLVTDAGTPGISDPGNKLIDFINANSAFANLNTIKIVPIPGASSLTSSISVSGFDMKEFLFLGFLPKKKGRQTLLNELKNIKRGIILFESPQRVYKTLGEVSEYFNSDRRICVLRELTKQFETIYRGTIGDIKDKIPEKELKGEFVIVIDREK